MSRPDPLICSDVWVLSSTGEWGRRRYPHATPAVPLTPGGPLPDGADPNTKLSPYHGPDTTTLFPKLLDFGREVTFSSGTPTLSGGGGLQVGPPTSLLFPALLRPQGTRSPRRSTFDSVNGVADRFTLTP